MLYRTLLIIICLFVQTLKMEAQPTVSNHNSSRETTKQDTAGNELTLKDCLKYALKNQPTLNQAYVDEAIAHINNLIGFSSWLPQVNGSATYQHYFQLPVNFTVFNGTLTGLQSGVSNISTPAVTASQTIFSTDVLLAARAAKLNTLVAKQNTASTKIELVSAISKAFYDLLLSVEQESVYKDDTARLKKNLRDTYNGYLSGIVDKVDYKQATITLNNSLTQLKSATEIIQAKFALLKQLMGLPAEKKFEVHFDTTQMLQEIYIDTLEQLQVEKRIEYQILQTNKRIQRETTLYYRLGWVPSLSAYYNYNYEFENNSFSDLYKRAYPYSLFGLQLNLPIFTGFRRMENVRKATLLEHRQDLDELNVTLTINTQYIQALASYKSNLYYLQTQHENKNMAREVYDIVKLQYREGVKPYLDVIVAESDLKTSEINYLNALFQVLESKIDLEKALGNIPTDI